jgi:hypothetical protein
MSTNSKEEYECGLAIIDLIKEENRESSNLMLIGDLNGDPFRSFKRKNTRIIDQQISDNEVNSNEDEEFTFKTLSLT